MPRRVVIERRAIMNVVNAGGPAVHSNQVGGTSSVPDSHSSPPQVLPTPHDQQPHPPASKEMFPASHIPGTGGSNCRSRGEGRPVLIKTRSASAGPDVAGAAAEAAGYHPRLYNGFRTRAASGTGMHSHRMQANLPSEPAPEASLPSSHGRHHGIHVAQASSPGDARGCDADGIWSLSQAGLPAVLPAPARPGLSTSDNVTRVPPAPTSTCPRPHHRCVSGMRPAHGQAMRVCISQTQADVGAEPTKDASPANSAGNSANTPPCTYGGHVHLGAEPTAVSSNCHARGDSPGSSTQHMVSILSSSRPLQGRSSRVAGYHLPSCLGSLLGDAPSRGSAAPLSASAKQAAPAAVPQPARDSVAHSDEQPAGHPQPAPSTLCLDHSRYLDILGVIPEVGADHVPVQEQ